MISTAVAYVKDTFNEGSKALAAGFSYATVPIA